MSEYEPITAELRRVMNHTTMAGVPLVEIGEYEFGHRCDAIDAVHAALERENAELRERLGALDNRSDSMHEIGSATITITPTVDWTGVARELRSIADALSSCNCSNSERTDGTCHADETDAMECVCDQVGRYGKRVTIHMMECSECGHAYEHVNGDYEYCPRCGRRIEVDA